ncbi:MULTISPECIES: cyclic di-GMP phosphodiesterase [Burkholderia cepacia complex]|jgi:c-di-GMP phosphodiesterase Gmr|uniref:Cyclic di-GMP phosphodiesterase n=1 Tax=Burkholderia vietnamiensis TaxID=60552 RepID=A0AAW7T4K0_BURVI|nr:MULTISPECIES: cyclic di-GMP phosphodiesterase [Burkholderia cepacia complex]MDN7797077.1 cyclic di-GMP phosphodiesterase [Burkholderia vietnamiensis]
MSADRGSNLLFARLGTRNPYWRLTGDSNALQLASSIGEAADVVVSLAREQAGQIRELTGVTAHMALDVCVLGEPLCLHLVGRKLTGTLWAGNAAAADDSAAVARELVHCLSFAEQVVSEVNSVVLIIDRCGHVRRFNRLAEEVTGLREADIIGRDIGEIFVRPGGKPVSGKRIQRLLAQEEPDDIELAIKTEDGERLFLFRNKLIRWSEGGEGRFLICCGADVTEERLAQRQLLELANTDPLTSLPNRNSIHEKIAVSIARSAHAQSVGILFLDLDNFKKINDHYGHVFGDRLLKDVSVAIATCLNKGDTLGRVSGDEFVVLVVGATAESLEAIARRILDRMRVPFSVGLVEVNTSCSIGIALSPLHGGDVETLIRSADTAMYVAKDEGKHTFRMFSPEMDRMVAEYVWLDSNLRHAIGAGELTLHYQPKLVLATGAVRSVEALVRWNSPQRGLVMPGEFIRYAEESGLIGALGRWVMQTAAAQAAHWKMQGLDLRIAINVSARQLVDSTAVHDFREALENAGLESSLLDIELTESCLIQNEATAIELIAQFKELGAEVHLDDFGTGYSSLAQLGRIPLDMIKLDPTFVRSINAEPRAQALMRSMIAVAQELSLKVVVEGVETEAEELFMKALGVDYVQGYRYGRPMPVIEFERWLANRPNIRLIA